MVEAFGEQDGFAAVTPSPQEAASTDKVTVGFHYLNVESFEVTTDELVDLAAALYTDARNARSAGMGGMWAVGFQGGPFASRHPPQCPYTRPAGHFTPEVGCRRVLSAEGAARSLRFRTPGTS